MDRQGGQAVLPCPALALLCLALLSLALPCLALARAANALPMPIPVPFDGLSEKDRRVSMSRVYTLYSQQSVQ